ncbi:putative cation-transporting ATPase [Cyclospora cayetanensis]|uniref:Cation-transporting ATPase n=1 Tax=Cyclospora cayetanensis TaxID=88456 RepID=A0A1D3D7A7_9EIME|nr:putative cation-transporting ATPase [Cyclospora cayetanensis]
MAPLGCHILLLWRVYGRRRLEALSFLMKAPQPGRMPQTGVLHCSSELCPGAPRTLLVRTRSPVALLRQVRLVRFFVVREDAVCSSTESRKEHLSEMRVSSSQRTQRRASLMPLSSLPVGRSRVAATRCRILNRCPLRRTAVMRARNEESMASRQARMRGSAIISGEERYRSLRPFKTVGEVPDAAAEQAYLFSGHHATSRVAFLRPPSAPQEHEAALCRRRASQAVVLAWRFHQVLGPSRRRAPWEPCTRHHAAFLLRRAQEDDLYDHLGGAGNSPREAMGAFSALEASVNYDHLSEQSELAPEERVVRVEGHRLNLPCAVLFAALSILTGGLFFLLGRWNPLRRFRFLYSPCPFGAATHVLISTAGGQYGFASLQRLPFSPAALKVLPEGASSKPVGSYAVEQVDGVKAACASCGCEGPVKFMALLFTFRHMRYLLEESDVEAFHPVCFDIALPPSLLLHALQQHAACPCLLRQRQQVFGLSGLHVACPPLLSLFAAEVLQPFYLCQVAAILLWVADAYYSYAAVISLITAVSTIADVLSRRRSLLRLKEVAEMVSTVEVLRRLQCRSSSSSSRRQDWKGLERMSVPSDSLTNGDLLLLKPGMRVPCDLLLLQGTVVLDERSLTGECYPVLKGPLPVHNQSNNCISLEQSAHMVFAGTLVLASTGGAETQGGVGTEENSRLAVGAVCRVGFATAQGETVRSLLFPSAPRMDFDGESLSFLLALAALTGLAASYTAFKFYSRNVSFESGFMLIADLFTDALPPALRATLSVSLTSAAARIASSYGISVLSPGRLNTCGFVRCVCFDKTGTLTEEGVSLLGCLPACHCSKRSKGSRCINDQQKAPVPNAGADAHGEHALLPPTEVECRGSTADAFTLLKRKLRGAAAAKASTFVFPQHRQEETSISEIEEDRCICVLRRFLFCSVEMRMSVVALQMGTQQVFIYSKGSPESILPLCKGESVLPGTEKRITTFAASGYRVLAAAWRPLAQGECWETLRRHQAEHNLYFLGLLIFVNELKPEARQTIAALDEARLDIRMLTGDSLHTAIGVASECGILDSHENAAGRAVCRCCYSVTAEETLKRKGGESAGATAYDTQGTGSRRSSTDEEQTGPHAERLRRQQVQQQLKCLPSTHRALILGEAAGGLQPLVSLDIRVLLALLPDSRRAVLVLTARAFRHLSRLHMLLGLPFSERCAEIVQQLLPQQQGEADVVQQQQQQACCINIRPWISAEAVSRSPRGEALQQQQDEELLQQEANDAVQQHLGDLQQQHPGELLLPSAAAHASLSRVDRMQELLQQSECHRAEQTEAAASEEIPGSTSTVRPGAFQRLLTQFIGVFRPARHSRIAPSPWRSPALVATSVSTAVRCHDQPSSSSNWAMAHMRAFTSRLALTPVAAAVAAARASLLKSWKLQETAVPLQFNKKDKGDFLAALQQLPSCPFVGMIGDGTNDLVAIKKADMGVSLSSPYETSIPSPAKDAQGAIRQPSEAAAGAGASLAAYFTIPKLSGCVELLREGRCVLQNSINTVLFITLYSLIQLTSVVCLYQLGGNLSDAQYMWIDLLTIMPLSLFLSQTEAPQRLSPFSPPSSLFARPVIVSVVGQVRIDDSMTASLCRLRSLHRAAFTSIYSPSSLPSPLFFAVTTLLPPYGLVSVTAPSVITLSCCAACAPVSPLHRFFLSLAASSSLPLCMHAFLHVRGAVVDTKGAAVASGGVAVLPQGVIQVAFQLIALFLCMPHAYLKHSDGAATSALAYSYTFMFAPHWATRDCSGAKVALFSLDSARGSAGVLLLLKWRKNQSCPTLQPFGACLPLLFAAAGLTKNRRCVLYMALLGGLCFSFLLHPPGSPWSPSDLRASPEAGAAVADPAHEAASGNLVFSMFSHVAWAFWGGFENARKLLFHWLGLVPLRSQLRRQLLLLSACNLLCTLAYEVFAVRPSLLAYVRKREEAGGSAAQVPKTQKACALRILLPT